MEAGSNRAAPSAGCGASSDNRLLMELRRLECVYRRRRETLEAREGDKAADRLFILGDGRPWVVFGRQTPTDRRRLALEAGFPVQWGDLHEAARVGDLEAARSLLRPPRSEVPRCSLRRDASGRLPLHQAVVSERWEVVRWVLKRADVALQLHAVDFSGRTPVHYALDLMERLALHHSSREAGQPVYSVTSVMRGSSARYRRLWRYSDLMIARMVSRDSTTEGGESVKALDFRIRGDVWDGCRYGDVKRLQFIAQTYSGSGCSHRLKDESVLGELKWSLLHEACSRGHSTVVNCLLTDDNFRHFRQSQLLLLQDSSGCTALHCASKRLDLDLCELLLQDVSVDTDSVDDLSFAADIMPLCQDSCGRTALHWSLLAARDANGRGVDRSEFAKWLAMKCPTALNLPDNAGMTPLHLAVWRGSVDLVHFFIELGANPGGVQQTGEQINGGNPSEKKATWAPCGRVFQHYVGEVTQLADNSGPDTNLNIPIPSDKSQTIDVSFEVPASTLLASSTKPLRLFECPVPTNSEIENEDVYYWMRRMTARRCTTPSRNIDTVRGSIKADHDAVGVVANDEPTGCLKYGGTCAVCRPSEKDNSSSVQRRISQALPLIVAIRRCISSKSVELQHRKATVLLLLEAGACPDGGMNSQYFAILEAVRTGQPDLIQILTEHGATKVDFDLLEHHCSSQWSLDTLENIVQLLLVHKEAASSNCMLAFLFEKKCFGVIRSVISLRKVACSELSAWQRIHEQQHKRQRKRHSNKSVWDEDHLLFLADFIGKHDVDGETFIEKELVDMIRIIVVACVHQIKSSRRSVLLEALEMTMNALIRHGIVGSVISAEKLITCGLFEAATVVLEAELESSKRISVDSILDAFCVGIRYLENTNTQTHRLKDDFLCLWLNKLTGEQSNATTITARAIISACAYNLPLTLIKRCIALVVANTQATNGEHDEFYAVSRLTDGFKAIRIGSRRLEQWIVVHRRLDVVHAIVDAISVSPDSIWSFWRKLMAAAAIEQAHEVSLLHGDGYQTHLNSFINALIAIPQSLGNMHEHSSTLELESLQWLLLRHFIPIDHDPMVLALLKHIGELEVLQTPQHNDTNFSGDSAHEPYQSGLLRWCIRSRFVYACARWNAVRVLNVVLNALSSLEERRSCLLDGVLDVDGVDPPTIARLLGHREISRLLPVVRNISAEDSTVDDPLSTPQPNTFGLIRAVLLDNEYFVTSESTDSLRSSVNFDDPSIVEDWTIACKLNRARQLAILADLSLSSSVLSQSFGQLLLACMSGGAIDALKWLLSKCNGTLELPEEAGACIDLAARRSTGDDYAKILLLLLDQRFPPGRLAGDGADITLLHHAACINNSHLARQLINRILSIEECDINVLDCYGNTPVVYALASGQLENACFLIQHGNCRLEAEYEGQASFYYTLNLVPSRPTRLIFKAFLMRSRSHAFLHCNDEAGTCACKGFEQPTASDGHDMALCGFCGHNKLLHTILPLPSWLRDQYDSYIDMRGHRHPSSSDDDEDRGYSQGDDDDDNEHLQEHLVQTQQLTDDELENARGRLDAADLAYIAVIRYGSIVQDFGIDELMIQSPIGSSDPTASDCDEEVERPASYWPMVEPEVLGTSTDPHQPVLAGNYEPEVEGADHIFQPQTFLNRLPCFLRADVALLHAPTCSCQQLEFSVTPQMLLYHTVCRWLRQAALDARGLTVSSAFWTWRRLQGGGACSNPREQLLKRAVVANWRLGRRVLCAFRRWRRQLSPAVALHQLEDAALGIAASMRRERLESLRARQAQVQRAARALLLDT